MKTTFGQILKKSRKSLGLSQAELGEKLGVSVQTVSRWENDGGMPDISQIVPLAKILGTSCDVLLGMENSEEEMIRDALNEVKHLSHIPGRHRKESEAKEGYEKLKASLRKFPTNCELLLSCSSLAINYLMHCILYHSGEDKEKETEALLRDIEKMTSTAITYSDNISEKLEAKTMLAFAYSYMGARDKAFEMIKDVPEPDRSRIRMWICIHLGDTDGRMSYGREYYSRSAIEFLWSFTQVIQSHACQGKEERANTLRMYKKYEEVAHALRSAVGYITYHNVLLYTYQNTVKEYLRDGDVDNALTYFEKLIDTCESFYKHLRGEVRPDDLEEYFWSNSDYIIVRMEYTDEVKNDPEKIKENFRYHLNFSIEELGDRENNPMVTSERYKKAIERFNAM